ncbi:MAG: ribonuclease E inhibitor RraB [Acidimicrobiia bacterium]|nr:ribonuclease E inhibitor RraB [Acidimicrobiia bacterium]
MALFRKNRRPDAGPPVEVPGLEEPDRKVLHQLVQAGADLREPRHGIFFVHFPDQRSAEAAAAAARARSFECRVNEPHPDDDPPQWWVVCEQHEVVLDGSTVRDLSAFFESIADAHGGHYDGWEASV